MTAMAAAARRKRRGRAIRVPNVGPLVRIVAVSLAFVLGVVGFGQAYAALGVHHGLYKDAVYALQLIVGSFPSDLDNRPLPWTLTVARWALPLLTFWSTIALAWAQLRNPLRLKLFGIGGDHLVIAGDDLIARRIADAERDEGRRVLLWSGEHPPAWTEKLLDRGAARVTDAAQLDRLSLTKARGVLLLEPDDSGNTARIAEILDETGEDRPAGDPLNVIARIDNPDLRRNVEARFDLALRQPARVRLVSLSDIAARELFVVHPLDRFQWSGDPTRRVLVLGFSPTIERYILRLLAGGHFRDGGKPQVIVIDPAAAEREAAFRAAHPGADTLSPVVFEPGAVGQAAQGATIAAKAIERHGSVISIIVDCGDEAASLALAMAIETEHLQSGRICPPIHVHSGAASSARLAASIHCFGGADSVSSPELLLQERHDRLARSIHDFYLEGRLSDGDRIGSRASMREWEDLPESFRDDNRLVADCYQIKLRDIGARVVPGTGPSLRLGEDELEELSRAEHDRWMAAKLATGWRYGEVRDDAARVHPDIKGYDALSEAIKDLDREQVRAMTRLLGAAGLRAMRLLSVAIVPGGDMDLAAAMPELLSGLAETYPDRILLLTGLLDDAASRDALLAAADASQRVRVLLSRNTQRIAMEERLGDREALTDLVRNADTVVALAGAEEAMTVAAQDADLWIGAAPVSDSPRPTVVIDGQGSITAAPWRQ